MIFKNIRLYGYRTLSQQLFDANYNSLGLSVAKIRVIFFVHLNFFHFFPINSKGFVNIYRIKNQMT